MTATDNGTTEIATRPAANGWGREQIDLLKATICAGATDGELALFVEASKRLGLDPFARQVFAVKRWDRNAGREVMAIQVSVDGFRLVAERTGKYAGQLGPFWTADGKEWLEVWLDSKPPAAAKVAVLRHDFKEPIWSVATWAQYKQEGKNGLTPMWAKMGPLMLAKCAESLALRRAFPNELSGVYTQEEMAQAVPAVEVEEHPADVQARAEYREAMKDSPGTAASKPAPPPPSAAPSSAPPSRGETKSRGSGANAIAHDGKMATPKQVQLIHVLRAKIPTLAATPEDPRSKWRATIQVYRRQDGSRCEHSNELSIAQAAHLLDRMQAKADELEAKEREIRSGNDNHAPPPPPPKVTPADLLEELHEQFATAAEEDQWLKDTGGWSSADDIPEESRAMVVALLKSLKRGPAAYATELTKARALGHIT